MDQMDVFSDEFDAEHVLKSFKKVAKNGMSDSVKLALVNCTVAINILKEQVIRDKSFSTRAKLSALKMCESDLKKRLKQIRQKEVRTKLNQELYRDRHSNFNPKHSQHSNTSLTRPSISEIELTPEMELVKKALLEGRDLKTYMPSYDNQTFEYGKLLTEEDLKQPIQEENQDVQVCSISELPLLTDES